MNNTNPQHLTPELKTTKQHFEILDGLRGIAAVSVVIFHFMEIAVPDYNRSFIANAYLAVDFFFCLSGFVIGYAYDNKLPVIGARNFFKLRLIRLHPLVLVGTVIGFVAFVLDPWSDLSKHYSSQLWLLLVTSALMIPYPIVRERYYNLFHLNPPTWSLFWEYIANILYAFFLIRVGKKTLFVLVAAAALLLIYDAQVSGNLAIGWGKDTFWGGPARMFFSFSAGLLIYRSGWILKTKLNFAAVGLLLFAIFLIPYRDALNHIIDPVIVILLFPLIVALGSGAKQALLSDKLCKFLGDLSYPLYMVHYPFIWLFMSYVEKYKPNIGKMTIIIIIAVPLLMAFVYAILKLIDEPLRKCLKRSV